MFNDLREYFMRNLYKYLYINYLHLSSAIIIINSSFVFNSKGDAKGRTLEFPEVNSFT